MKILIIGPHKSPIIQRLVKALKNRNHTVWTVSHDSENEEEIINLGKLSKITDYFRFNKVKKIVDELNPDVVHAHVLNHYGLMALTQKKPLVVALWGSDVMITPYQGNFLKKIIFKFINYVVLRSADKCHTSGYHVAIEANNQYNNALQKTRVFYWGLPLTKPNDKEGEKILRDMQSEFGIDPQKKYVVFPRGLSPIYNPDLVANIINKLLCKVGSKKQIVVLKGFATKEDEEKFSKKINLKEVTYINRLLTSEELYQLYTNTLIHVSVPLSDSLGGGVVEPALSGSFPILSNLPSYIEYASKYPAHIIPSINDKELENTVNIILEILISARKSSAPSEYSTESVVEKIELLYKEAINSKVKE